MSNAICGEWDNVARLAKLAKELDPFYYDFGYEKLDKILKEGGYSDNSIIAVEEVELRMSTNNVPTLEQSFKAAFNFAKEQKSIESLDSVVFILLSEDACVLHRWKMLARTLKMAENIKPDCDGLIALPSANQYKNLAGFKCRTDKHSHGHFIRAIMNSTTKSLAELADGLCQDEKPNRFFATGGGAKSNLWLQLKADVLGAKFVTTNCDEPACRGAAMLAATAAGWSC